MSTGENPPHNMTPIERTDAEQRASAMLNRGRLDERIPTAVTRPFPTQFMVGHHTAALHQVLGQIYTDVKAVLQEFTLTMETHVEADGRIRLKIEAKYDPFDEARAKLGQALASRNSPESHPPTAEAVGLMGAGLPPGEHRGQLGD